ncbi:sensor histidine kinase [Bacillus sp. HMF5848]|uniref:sensor histidine kinase n=1 Tax=Bacillus sp. HMF5848 TaxID=2495421 RepID=UPI000F79760C|nr:ATP-binding protein [Bacillus sp. HMF5848]RSK29124.1 sensor histidine kinase [Bacillus sp. HMF5848]
MIKYFLKERLSWILFFFSMHILLLFVTYIDSSIPLGAILYAIFISVLLFLFFILFRYHNETRFYKSLEGWDCETIVNHPNSPFEAMVKEKLEATSEQLKTQRSIHISILEEEQESRLAWIHEVKTPLTAMHLMIDRIQDEALKEQLTYEWLRIHLLLDQQLHQTRILNIENDLYIEHVELKPIIHKEIRDLHNWCRQKGIGFDLQLEATHVVTDSKWIAFILRQLLTNAIKYSNGTDISIKSYPRGERIVVEVQDFGRGIDAKDMPRIFDKGFTSTTRHHDNAATGMGLYLTKKVAKVLLIKIEVQSQLHEGTTFLLTFPKKNEFINVISM